MTYFGRCLEFSSFDLGPQLAKLGKREIQMSVLASYNTSDWSHGWVSMMEGFSIFVNSEMEETLDDALTVLSGDRRKLVIQAGMIITLLWAIYRAEKVIHQEVC